MKDQAVLGLVKEGSGVAANVLLNLDVDLRKVRVEVEKPGELARRSLIFTCHTPTADDHHKPLPPGDRALEREFELAEKHRINTNTLRHDKRAAEGNNQQFFWGGMGHVLRIHIPAVRNKRHTASSMHPMAARGGLFVIRCLTSQCGSSDDEQAVLRRMYSRYE